MKPRIMVVDDEPMNTTFISSALDQEFHILTCDSGYDCLEKITEFRPQAILLDVYMPKVDGFEVCRQLRQQPDYKHTVVVFLTAQDHLDNKLRGYQVGADDFLTKPLVIDEIKAKLTTLINRAQQQAVIEAEKCQALETAMMALVNGSELGEVNHFFQHLHSCTTFEALADHVLSTCRRFNLDAVVQLRSSFGELTIDGNGAVSQLEAQLLPHSVHAERIISVGKRCLLNYPTASLLVRNMPIHDNALCGRYRDHLATLMAGLESRMHSLTVEYKLQTQQQGLVINTLKDTHGALDDIMYDFKKIDQQSRETIECLLTDMEMAFCYLDLDEEQERYLIDLVNNAMTKLVAISTNGIKLDRRFENIIDNLNSMLRTYH